MKNLAVLCAAMILFCALLFCPASGWAEGEGFSDQEIDIDLSLFSGTFVYAQIYQMAIHPEDYVGKVIRVAGWYDVYVDSETGMVYTACTIPDATACCAQGIEFVWAGDHAFPGDFPEVGAEITVTGRFETYFEGEWEYMRLADAKLEWMM